MKKLTSKLIRLAALLVVIASKTIVYAQDEGMGVIKNANVQEAPQSPAFLLLNVANSDIQRPTDPTDVQASILGATQNLTVFPANFAMEIAPVYLISGQKIKFQDLMSNKIEDNVTQSWVLSVATSLQKDDANNNLPRFAIGSKFSLLRGNVDPAYKQKIAEVHALQDTVLSELDFAKDAQYILLKSKHIELRKQLKDTLKTAEEKEQIGIELGEIGAAIAARKAEISENYGGPKLDALKKAAADLDMKRYGFKADIAFGFVMDFPGGKAKSTAVSKGGVWLTAGHEGKVHSVLTVFRYFRFPDQQYVDERDSLVSKSNSVFDFGVRAGVEAVKNFTFSGEFIYRTYINNKALNDAEKNSKTARFKFTANFEYEFLKNKFLTFTVGRDFDSPVKTGGNVILALQAALGFGSTRTVK